MRGVLETHFSCASCGQELELVYENQIDKEAWKKAKRLTTTNCTDITGGSKVESRVFVVPCKICMEPAKRILEAVKTLQQIP